MARRRKRKEIHIIDMNSRTRIKIVKTTVEEENKFDQELNKMDENIEKSMEEYEKNLRRLMQRAISEPVVKSSKEQTEYFIKTYKKEYEHRNKDNIRKRYEILQKYLQGYTNGGAQMDKESGD